ncbi:hypothetical protein QAD02_010711 [Eretmocerus hayati]|uniref:Uncharacterized protein n=1 Tax=Eretmocerus hayati TaxID=131215 RepID=A0ACC2NZE9_9HYME|nr:hypothetical protein QAD02_010711 [Eretmocerus hayati]
MITQRLVLTAAHCLEDADYVRIFKLRKSMLRPYEIFEKITHPSFHILPDGTTSQDIGLIVLRVTISDSETVKLPPRNLYVPTGATAPAFGWGITEFGSRSREMRKVNLSITYAYPCTTQDQYDSHWICTKSQKRDICDGDSGGPLVWNNYVVGIVSWGNKSCRSGVPSVFTKVSAYRDWIDGYILEY